MTKLLKGALRILSFNNKIKAKAFYLGYIFIFLLACEDQPHVSRQDSTQDPNQDPSAQVTGNIAQTEEEPFYTITNDFQDYDGTEVAGVSLYLQSLNTGSAYIIPPTKYSPATLTHFIINMQIKEGCIELPASAFPVVVGVCKSAKCEAVRSLNVALKQPAHYNISGIGGLLTPAVYPVSPCSPEALELVEAQEPYETINTPTEPKETQTQ